MLLQHAQRLCHAMSLQQYMPRQLQHILDCFQIYAQHTHLQCAQRLLPRHEPAAVHTPAFTQQYDAAGLRGDAAAHAHRHTACQRGHVWGGGGRVKALHLHTEESWDIE